MTGTSAFGALYCHGVRGEVLALAKGWQRAPARGAERAGPAGGARLDLFEIYHGAFTEEHKRGPRTSACSATCAASRTCALAPSRLRPLRLDSPATTRLRVFNRAAMNLSDELPLIASFGFKVVDEYVRPVHIAHMKEVEFDNYRFEPRFRDVWSLADHEPHKYEIPGTRCGRLRWDHGPRWA